MTEATERYLEAIYILENTGQAIAARVAERLGVRAPSVTQFLKRMTSENLLLVAPDRTLHLTAEGERLAKRVMRRHRVLERWLVEGLGLGWAEAHGEAQRMEHAVSTEVIDRLYETLGHPSVCPHGNPIPGPSGLPPYRGRLTLADAAAGARLLVVRIAEDAEENVEYLRQLDLHSVRPGTTVEVLANEGRQVVLAGGDGERAVSSALAAKIWCEDEA